VFTKPVPGGLLEFWDQISQKEPKSTPRSWLNV